MTGEKDQPKAKDGMAKTSPITPNRTRNLASSGTLQVQKWLEMSSFVKKRESWWDRTNEHNWARSSKEGNLKLTVGGPHREFNSLMSTMRLTFWEDFGIKKAFVLGDMCGGALKRSPS
jgi:hypothetical protein